MTILREVPEGVQSEVIFVHDVELPREFQPRNEDGEVAEFRRASVPGVVGIMRGAAHITLDAGLVMLSFLVHQNCIALGRDIVSQVVTFGP